MKKPITQKGGRWILIALIFAVIGFSSCSKPNNLADVDYTAHLTKTQDNAMTAADSQASRSVLPMAHDVDVSAAVGQEVDVNNIKHPSLVFNNLGTEEQLLYTRIKNAMFAFEAELDQDLEGFPVERIGEINQYVLNDYPEIFWANDAGITYYEEEGESRTPFKYAFNYLVDEPEQQDIANSIDQWVLPFLEQIPDDASEYEKVLQVYQFVLENTDYDLDVRDKIEAGNEDDAVFLSQTITSVFLEHKSVCAGLSKAIQYLLQRLDVECYYVTGQATGQGNHAWNLLSIDSDYYLLDATFGKPISMDSSQAQLLTYNYFCLTDAEFARTHIADAYQDMPECTATTYDYYIYNNLYLASADYSLLEHIIFTNMNQGNDKISVKFADGELANQMNQALFSGNQRIFSIIGRLAEKYPNVDPNTVESWLDRDVNVLLIEICYLYGS